MTPSFDRFMGALQGVGANPVDRAGGAALEVAESLLTNGAFVVRDIEAAVQDAAAGGERGAVPLWGAISVGLWYFNELDTLPEAAEKVCRLTHGDPADIAAATGMALAVARLLRMQELVPPQFVREIAWFIRKIDEAAYARIMGLGPQLKGEELFAAGDLSLPLELFRAALYLFLSCKSCDLHERAAFLGLAGTPALSLAYSLAGSFGQVCRAEKPSLRVVMIAEGLQKRA